MTLISDLDSPTNRALPTFAVIIPVYNGRKHLAETLESVLGQEQPPDEIIVIEDGSPVPSADIVQAFPTVRYVTQKNSGVSQSRNHGASLAASEWLCFLDQDDVLSANHLAQLTDAIRNSEAADVYYTPRLLLMNTTSGWVTTPTTAPPSPAELPHDLLLRCPFPPSGISIRKQIFQSSGGFLPKYDLAEDWEFWLRLMTQGHVFHRCTKPTMCYRVHLESNSHRPLPILTANLRVIREMILPLLSPWSRLWVGKRMISRQEADAAILLRQTGQPGGIALLLRSLFRFPFGNGRRYKIISHMILFGSRMVGHPHNSAVSQ
jgi:glycosyltransferase involved in cell wall biosynthesis